MIYGTTCRYGCYSGYEIAGSAHELECRIDKSWSYDTPYCKKITCPALPSTEGKLYRTCTDRNRFGSICIYTCSAGYDIPSNMNRIRICGADRRWRGEEPVCKDTEPPKFQNCSNVVEGYADRNSTKGTIFWSEPTATDNSNVVFIHNYSSISIGSIIEAGVYQVVYMANDTEGNSAVPCKMKIIMKILKCPRMFEKPYQRIICESGTKYGSICRFECDYGAVLNGTKAVSCEKSSTGNFAMWSWGSSQLPFCDVLITCPEIKQIPKNGALVCDNWLGGQFCRMFCKAGFDVQTNFRLEDMLVCGMSSDKMKQGKWLPVGSLPLPDCAKTHHPTGGRLVMHANFYFAGDCTDEAVIEEIKKKFIEAFKESLYQDACFINAKDCTVQNVKVRCGLTERKRSSDIGIDFEIIAELDSTNFEETFRNFSQSSSIVTEKLEEMKREGYLNLTLPDGGVLVPEDFSAQEVTLACSNNTVPSFRTLSCVECAPGTYFDNKTRNCPLCPKGHYQPSTGQNSCIVCPQFQTTRIKGAQNLDECTEACEPGSWSLDGTPICSLCSEGSYNEEYGQDQCTKCPYSQTTQDEGSKTSTDCKDFDIVLLHNTSTIRTEFAASKTFVKFILKMWIYIAGDERLILTLENQNSSIDLNMIGGQISETGKIRRFKHVKVMYRTEKLQEASFIPYKKDCIECGA
ncbi:sushi, von Willebrand factor type A, EGF and pentraxin domain-containing protein 1-like [Saccostrea cucullata]|uniref:sushi, von Willebrand factor type A, EGF and pentraxin domain-containing protein 1-like n=1 Tax=Saccostrea cuccullata TaxID=36930 RepID=UPI002ED27570